MKSKNLHDKLNVFVYDTSRGFSRMIKSQYGREYTIDVCSYPIRFRENGLGQTVYDFAFININSYEDLSVFVELDASVEYLFVCSPFLDVNRLLPKFTKVILLDSTLLRRDMVKIINKHIATICAEVAIAT